MVDTLKNQDWYFMLSDSEDGSASFYIVHKRFWHLQHHIDDQSISYFLSVPEQFSESCESLFTYQPDPEDIFSNMREATKAEFTDATQKLRDAGFTYLADPFWHSERSYYPVRGRSESLQLQCDTSGIKALANKLFDGFPARGDSFSSEWDNGSYLDIITDFAEQNGLIFPNLSLRYSRDPSHWPGMTGTLLTPLTHASLPKFPKGYYDDGDEWG